MIKDLQTPDLWFFVLTRELMAILSAVAGGLLAAAWKKVSHLTLCLLISFAAGALLSLTVLDIIPEAIEQVGWASTAWSAFAGYALFFALTRFLFHLCPACSATHTEINFKALTFVMVAALGIHSFVDGLAVCGGYLAVSPGLGSMMLLGVALHKFPEGMAFTAVARGSAIDRGKAFLACVVLETLTTLGGGAVGLLALGPLFSRGVGHLLGFVGGAFIFLVIHALLSEVIKHHPRSTLLAAAAGALLMIAAGSLAPQHP